MTPLETAPPPVPAGPWQRVISFMERCATEPTGLLGAVIVLVVALLVDLIGWTRLGWIPGILNKALSFVGPKSCGIFSGKLLLPFCGAALAIYTHMGLAILLAVLLRFRRALAAGVKFLMAWAGVPFHFFDRAARPALIR
jgi:hypothetical protein